MTWLGLAGTALGAALAATLYTPTVGLLRSAGAVRPNYQGRLVPVAGGLIFVVAGLFAQSLQWLLAVATGGFGFPTRLLDAAAVTLLGFGLLGLIDDLLGSRETGGFKGHFRLLFREGRLTSGALKAIGGAVVASWAAGAGLPSGWLAAGRAAWYWGLAGLVNLLLVALCANTVNLLDLRPGRALKGFLLLMALGLAVGRPGHPGWLWVYPVLGAALVVGFHDLKAEVMMGDTGANVLGGLTGAGIAWSWQLGPKLGLLAALVAFHLYTERISLSAVIERVAPLRWLDHLGRPAGQEGDGT